jgi:glycerol uptake facilitator protein
MMEFIGAYVIVLIGCGAVFVAVYIGACKDLAPVMLMWAFAVVIPVYVGAAVSGACFNPSVTIALAVWRGFPWRRVPAHLVSQVAGAFCGAVTLWFALHKGFAPFFEAQHHLVRGVFGSQFSSMVFTCCIPNPGIVGYTADAYAKVPLYAGFFSEFIGTAVLLIMIFALLEEKNSLKPSMPAFPYILGAVVFAVVGLTAPLSMTSLNGARDLGPRILAYMLGWGDMAFPGLRGEWWILTVAPILGAVFAGFVYDKIAVKIFSGTVPEAIEVKEEKRTVTA